MILKNNYRKNTIIASLGKDNSSAIHIIKISGEKTKEVINFFKNNKLKKIEPRRVYMHNYKTNTKLIDQVSFIFYKKPKSYTGEDLVEVFNHGNLLITEFIVNDLIKRFGLVRARNGEFTKRAFINGKLDLVQADSICKLSNVNSVDFLHSINTEVSGVFSKTMLFLEKHIEGIILYLEGSLESRLIDMYGSGLITLKTITLQKLIRGLLQKNKCLTYRKVNLSMLGAPNVGKSSTLNTLFKKKLSIVSLHEGTTRDSICKGLEKLPLVFLDTAGIYKTKGVGLNSIGVSNTLKRISGVGFYIWIVDLYTRKSFIMSTLRECLRKTNSLIVLNKADSYKNYSKNPYIKVFLKKFKKFRVIPTSIIEKPFGVRRLKFLIFLSMQGLLKGVDVRGG